MSTKKKLERQMKKYKIIREFPLHNVGDVFETRDNVVWKCMNHSGSMSSYIPMELKELVNEGYLEEVERSF